MLAAAQCVLVQARRAGRKIGELELDFENPTWKSNWDFEEFTVKFTIRFTIIFTIYDIRKIGELELDFENPKAGRAGWKSNWDFEEFAVKFKAGWAGVKFTVRFTINFIINNITQKSK